MTKRAMGDQLIEDSKRSRRKADEELILHK